MPNFDTKVEIFLKGNLDLIPSPSVKIKIMGGKVCLRVVTGPTFRVEEAAYHYTAMCGYKSH